MSEINHMTSGVLSPRARVSETNEEQLKNLQDLQIMQSLMLQIDAQELKRVEIDFNREITISKKNLDLMAQQDRWIA